MATINDEIDAGDKAARDRKPRTLAELWGSAKWEGDLMEWRRSKDFPE